MLSQRDGRLDAGGCPRREGQRHQCRGDDDGGAGRGLPQRAPVNAELVAAGIAVGIALAWSLRGVWTEAMAIGAASVQPNLALRGE